MNDAYRLLKPGAQLMMVMPHASSARSIIDPKSKWPPLREESFMVYNKAWREQEGMGDLGLTCDFVNPGVGHVDHPGLIGRNEDFVAYVKEHEVNWVSDLHVTLTKGA
jgi:hypothetical protein